MRSRFGSSPSRKGFLPGRSGGSACVTSGEPAGSASVATRSEIRLRIMSAVSIAWYLSARVSAPKWCFVPGREHSGCMVSAGTNATKKQFPLRFKGFAQEIFASNAEVSQN